MVKVVHRVDDVINRKVNVEMEVVMIRVIHRMDGIINREVEMEKYVMLM